MFYPARKEGKIISKFIIQEYKSAYEMLKRQCKHHIMVKNGEVHAVIAILKSHTFNNKEEVYLPLNMSFELSIISASDLPTYNSEAKLYEQPMILYMPDASMCKSWADSPLARKARIKDILNDLKDEEKKKA